MVHPVSGGHGATDPHHPHQALNSYIPAIAQHGSQPDTFEHSHGGGGHGHGAHGAASGNFLQRIGNKISTIFWDAISLPKVLLTKLWETFTGNHAGHDHGHEEPFQPESGFLSKNLADHSMPQATGPNEFLATKGYLSGDLTDESGLYDKSMIVPF